MIIAGKFDWSVKGVDQPERRRFYTTQQIGHNKFGNKNWEKWKYHGNFSVRKLIVTL